MLFRFTIVRIAIEICSTGSLQYEPGFINIQMVDKPQKTKLIDNQYKLNGVKRILVNRKKDVSEFISD